MDAQSIILALLIGGVVVGGYLAIEALLRKKGNAQNILRRVDSAEKAQSHEPTSTEELEEKSSLAYSLDSVLALILPLLGKSLEEESEKVAKQLLFAGMRSPNTPSYYLFFQYVISVLFLLMAIPQAQKGGASGYIVALILVVMGLWGPKLYLTNAINKRKDKLVRSFPDSLDLLLVCVESGLAMDAAFARVCNELGTAHPEITGEFNRTRLELSLLNDRTKALHNLGERTDITAFKALSAALIQTEKFGTSLSDTLRVMSDDYRQTRLMEAENRANRLPALMTIPLMTMLLPALFIIILAPAVISIMSDGGIGGLG